MPLDALPDISPAVGFADDAAAVAAMIAAVGNVIKPVHRAKAREMLGLPKLETPTTDRQQ
jgi:uncharacterized membrane protein YkvA (DUF1232 family)